MCPPAGVNFTELESRLITHCRILSGSTCTFWMLGDTSVETVSFFLKLWGSTDSMAACRMSFTSTTLRCSWTPRASIRERSRMEEMSRSSDSPLSRMVFK